MSGSVLVSSCPGCFFYTTDPIRDAALKQQQKITTCISSKVQSLGYDRLPKRTGRATIADRVVFFSKNATLVSLVCDNGIFNPSDGSFSAWPFIIQSMGHDLRKQNNYVCMSEAGLGRGVNEQAVWSAKFAALVVSDLESPR